MADKLHFSLVSPERELVSKEVDAVDIPGVEGLLGILPNHAPFMTILAPGIVILKNGNEQEKFLVRGGFAEVTPAGLTVLAEEATPVTELDKSSIDGHLSRAREELSEAGDNAEKSLGAQQNIECLEELQKSL